MPRGPLAVDHTSRRLAHLAAEDRRAATVKVAFQTVAHRFVQQHAAPAGAEHDWKFTSGRGFGFQIHQRLAQRFIDAVLPKIRAVRGMIDASGRDIDLQVDGGITPETAPRVREAGAGRR